MFNPLLLYQFKQYTFAFVAEIQRTSLWINKKNAVSRLVEKSSEQNHFFGAMPPTIFTLILLSAH